MTQTERVMGGRITAGRDNRKSGHGPSAQKTFSPQRTRRAQRKNRKKRQVGIGSSRFPVISLLLLFFLCALRALCGENAFWRFHIGTHAIAVPFQEVCE